MYACVNLILSIFPLSREWDYTPTGLGMRLHSHLNLSLFFRQRFPVSGGFLRLTVPSLWAILGVGGDIISASFLATVCVCVCTCVHMWARMLQNVHTCTSTCMNGQMFTNTGKHVLQTDIYVHTPNLISLTHQTKVTDQVTTIQNTGWWVIGVSDCRLLYWNLICHMHVPHMC